MRTHPSSLTEASAHLPFPFLNLADVGTPLLPVAYPYNHGRLSLSLHPHPSPPFLLHCSHQSRSAHSQNPAPPLPLPHEASVFLAPVTHKPDPPATLLPSSPNPACHTSALPPPSHLKAAALFPCLPSKLSFQAFFLTTDAVLRSPGSLLIDAPPILLPTQYLLSPPVSLQPLIGPPCSHRRTPYNRQTAPCAFAGLRLLSQAPPTCRVP